MWVSDEGIGVSQDEAARIFGRFHRGEAARHPDAARPGAGLGLAIVRSIAEAHHGTAWVRSSEGEGATFGLTIPAPDEDQDAAGKPHRSERTGAEPQKEQP